MWAGLAITVVVLIAAAGYLTTVAPKGTTTLTSSISSSTTSTGSLETTVSSTTTSSSSNAGVVDVSIVEGAIGNQSSSGYAPSTIEVVIGVNNTVIWTNNDGTVHTVTCIYPPAGAQGFNSGPLSPRATFTYTFTVSGTYVYNCQFHSWMSATIIVKS
jgi:plastocyanin